MFEYLHKSWKDYFLIDERIFQFAYIFHGYTNRHINVWNLPSSLEEAIGLEVN